MAKIGKTKQQELIDKRKEASQDEDYLKEVDKPLGWKYVQQVETAAVKKYLKDKADLLTDLQGDARQEVTYISNLARCGQQRLDTIDWPITWEATCIPTFGKRIRVYGKGFESSRGVLFVVKNTMGDVFIRGCLASFDPPKDLHAVGILVEQAENVLDSAKGLLNEDKNKKEDKIWLPGNQQNKN